mmetsp:Transcript_19710/g.41544  ORF Transcript_19710/g.41544 Transcript_19710/m.41544 type:complete len:336 (+) Transcript_19710:91-1098(+)
MAIIAIGTIRSLPFVRIVWLVAILAILLTRKHILRRSLEHRTVRTLLVFHIAQCLIVHLLHILQCIILILVARPLPPGYLLRLILLLRHHHPLLLPLLTIILPPPFPLLLAPHLGIPIARAPIHRRNLHAQPIRQRLAHLEELEGVGTPSVLLAELAEHVGEDHVHHSYLVLFVVGRRTFEGVFVRVWIEVGVVLVFGVSFFCGEQHGRCCPKLGAGLAILLFFALRLLFRLLLLVVVRRFRILGNNVRPRRKLNVFLLGIIQKEFVVGGHVDLWRGRFAVIVIASGALFFIVFILFGSFVIAAAFLFIFIFIFFIFVVFVFFIQLLLRFGHPHQ